jgi:hypothetical protein
VGESAALALNVQPTNKAEWDWMARMVVFSGMNGRFRR